MRIERARGFTRFSAVVALAAAMTLTLASSASAAFGGSGTLAPIGTGSYLLEVTNTGSGIQGFVLPGPGFAHNAVASKGTCQELLSSLLCSTELGMGELAQVCYSGPSVSTVDFDGAIEVPVTSVPAVGSCPLPGFTPAPTAGSGPAPGGEDGGTGSGSGGGGSSGGSGSSGSTAGAFSLGKVKDNAKKGTAALVANVPGAGTLALSGKSVKASTLHPTTGGPVTLTVKATGKAASKLAQNGKAQVKVSVTFIPAGGSPTSASKTVKLIES